MRLLKKEIREQLRIVDRLPVPPSTDQKSLGQIDYEADCAQRPTDPDGHLRKRWDELSELERGWLRHPSPRGR